MRPRKNRPVLFEVVASTQRARGRSPVPPPAAPSTVPGDVSASPCGPPTTAALAAPPEIRPRSVEVRVAGGRVHVALTSLQATAAGIGLLVLLAAVFFAGRRSAEPPQTRAKTIEDLLVSNAVPEPPPTEARPPTPSHGRNAGPVATPLAQPSEDAPAAKAPPREPAPPPQKSESGEAFSFVRDSYYVVVQHFRLRDQARAEGAQEFLRGKGIACTIRAGTDLQLIATERFASEPQADALRKRIADLGKEYRESGGGYDFASAKARKF